MCMWYYVRVLAPLDKLGGHQVKLIRINPSDLDERLSILDRHWMDLRHPFLTLLATYLERIDVEGLSTSLAAISYLRSSIYRHYAEDTYALGEMRIALCGLTRILKGRYLTLVDFALAYQFVCSLDKENLKGTEILCQHPLLEEIANTLGRLQTAKHPRLLTAQCYSPSTLIVTSCYGLARRISPHLPKRTVLHAKAAFQFPEIYPFEQVAIYDLPLKMVELKEHERYLNNGALGVLHRHLLSYRDSVSSQLDDAYLHCSSQRPYVGAH